MKKIKRLITNTIVDITTPLGVFDSTTIMETHVTRYFTACGVNIVDNSRPVPGGLTFVINNGCDDIKWVNVLTIEMSYVHMTSLYEKVIEIGPSFITVLQCFTKACNSNKLTRESYDFPFSIMAITPVFDMVLTKTIEYNTGILDNIFNNKNISLILKKFGGEKGMTKLFEEVIDAVLDAYILEVSPYSVIHNKCSTCSRCRIINGLRTCDDRYIRLRQGEDLSKYPNIHFSEGKLWSEYVFRPQTICRLYSSR